MLMSSSCVFIFDSNKYIYFKFWNCFTYGSAKSIVLGFDIYSANSMWFFQKNTQFHWPVALYVYNLQTISYIV